MTDLAAIIGLSWVGGCVLLFIGLYIYGSRRPPKPLHDPLD